jgi:hypothetical protein
VAKAKAARPSKVRSVGSACVLATICAAGGYYVVKKNVKIEDNIASLMSPVKKATVPPPSTKPAPETTPEPKHVAARAVKPTDKVRLARLIKTAAEPIPVATSTTGTEDKEQPPLSITLLEKDAFQAAAEGQDNPNKVTLSVDFENLAGKPIRAFEGTLKFTDQLDKKIYSSKISVSAMISQGASLKWDEHLDAGKLDDKGKRLLGEDRENLKAVFQVKKVFFVDGTVKTYGLRG